MKTQTVLFALTAAAACTTASTNADVLLGGFDGGTSTAINFGGDDAVKQDASAVGNVSVTLSGVVLQRPFQLPTSLWGTADLDPDAELTDVAVNNNNDANLTFVVTNTGSQDVTLNTFHFVNRRDGGNSATSGTFSYVSGDLTAAGGGSTVVGLGAAQTLVTHDIDLSSILSDQTLSAGESATFNLLIDGDQWIRIDNTAFSGDIVPEPGSLTLMGLAGLGLLRRR